MRTLIHSAVCLATGPQPPPKRVLRTVRSSASSFSFQCRLFFLRSSSSAHTVWTKLMIFVLNRVIVTAKLWRVCLRIRCANCKHLLNASLSSRKRSALSFTVTPCTVGLIYSFYAGSRCGLHIWNLCGCKTVTVMCLSTYTGTKR
jgi:hypothetical protein